MPAPSPDPLIAECREAAAAGASGLLAGHRQSGAENALYVLLAQLSKHPDPEAETARLLGALTYELSDVGYVGPALAATQDVLNQIAAMTTMHGPGRLRQIAMMNLLLDAIGLDVVREAAEEALDEGAER